MCSVISVSRAGHPPDGCRPPCRSRRHKALPPSHFASSASLAREVLLMCIPSLPRCTCFRHPGRRLLMNSAIRLVVPCSWTSMRRASFQVAQVERQRRLPYPQSLRWTRFQSVREIFRNPRTEHPGKVSVTAGLQCWTSFQACECIRLLGSLDNPVNAGPCTSFRGDPGVKDSRQHHFDHQSLMSERAQAAVREAFCSAPTVACHICGHCPPGCWREVGHDKGTLDSRHLHVQMLFTRADTCSFSVVAPLT